MWGNHITDKKHKKPKVECCLTRGDWKGNQETWENTIKVGRKLGESPTLIKTQKEHWRNTPSKNSQVKKRLWENSVYTLLQNNTPTTALEEELWSMRYANKSRIIKRQVAASSPFTDISETQVKTAEKCSGAGSTSWTFCWASLAWCFLRNFIGSGESIFITTNLSRKA